MFFKIKWKGTFFKMKNKLVLALGVLLIFGMVFMACDTGNGPSKGGDSKTIVIEGIPDIYNGCEGTIRVFSDLNNVDRYNMPVNAGINYAVISDGKLAVELAVPQDNQGVSSTKWTGNGSYYIYFMTDIDGAYMPYYAMIYVGNGQEPQKYNINEAVITIPYSAFKQYDVRKQ
jgi:hypothetical protein